MTLEQAGFCKVWKDLISLQGSLDRLTSLSEAIFRSVILCITLPPTDYNIDIARSLRVNCRKRFVDIVDRYMGARRVLFYESIIPADVSFEVENLLTFCSNACNCPPKDPGRVLRYPDH